MSTNRLKRKKLTLTLKDKNEIIQRIDRGDNYQDLSLEYGIGRSTIYDIFRNREGIEKAAIMPFKSQRKTLRTPEHPELEEKLYAWYLEERHLYHISGSLMMVKARTIHKEMTGNDDFLASSGWLDRFKKRNGVILGNRDPPPAAESEQSSQSSSGAHSQAQASPEVPVVDPLSDQPGLRVEKSSSGNQLVIRVSDKHDSKTNVFNRFSVSDGHFENNIIVKEEQEDHQHENEESPEQMEAEEETKEFSSGEEMFPAVQAVLGDQESGSEDTSKALKELNDTFCKFVSEYSERTQALRERTALDRERISLDREKLALDRARLQYEMDTFKTKNGSAPKSDS